MDVDIPSRRISSGNAGGTPLYNPSKALTTGTTNRNNANGTCCESEISPPKRTRITPIKNMVPKSARQSAASNARERLEHTS